MEPERGGHAARQALGDARGEEIVERHVGPHIARVLVGGEHVDLEGKRIGFVSNEQWQAYRMLPLLKTLLERDFAGIEVLPIDAYPQGNALIGTEETAAQVKQSGVDAVIIGNAA